MKDTVEIKIGSVDGTTVQLECRFLGDSHQMLNYFCWCYFSFEFMRSMDHHFTASIFCAEHATAKEQCKGSRHSYVQCARSNVCLEQKTLDTQRNRKADATINGTNEWELKLLLVLLLKTKYSSEQRRISLHKDVPKWQSIAKTLCTTTQQNQNQSSAQMLSALIRTRFKINM